METKYKGGKLTAKEKSFIKANSGVLTAAQMSLKMKRTISIIEEYLEESNFGGLHVSETLESLRRGHEYGLLKDELTDRELKIFEKKYSEWVGQFQEDITASEKNQIFDTIKLQIMMSKVLQRNKAIEETVSGLEAEIKALREDEEMDDEIKQKRIKDLRDYKRDIYTNFNANDRVYQEQQKLHLEMLKSLNASRNQRVTKNDNKKNTFMSLMRNMQDDAQRNQIGNEVELEKLAAISEGERFKETTTFLDGSLVEPFISGQN